jgi:hypothetical protein
MTETVYDNPYTVTGLSASMGYDFYVQADCGNGNYSNMSNVYTVATECDMITALPLMENFDSYAGATTTSVSANNLPYCWSNINTGTSTSYSGYPIIYASATYAASGNNSMRFYTYSTSGTYSDQIAVLPRIDVNTFPMNTLQLSFDARALSTSYVFNLVVGVLTDPTNVSTFVPVQTLNITSTSYANFEVPFYQYADTGAYIAIKAPQPTSGYNYGYVDNIIVEIAPLCPKPTNVFASNITADGADIDWLPGGSETDWEIVVVPHGMAITTGTPEAVSTHPYTLTNLNDNTSYDVYVRADCGTGSDFSSWSQVCNFSTTPLCSAPTDVTVSQIAGTSALLTWTEAIFGATAYTVAYTETGQNSWNTQSVTGNSYMLTGLTPETPYTVTITSECNEGTAPVITKTFTTHCLSGGEIAIGSGTTTSTYIPSYSFYNYGYSQQIFLSSEMGGPTNITSISMNMSALSQQRNYKIYLVHTSQTSLASGWASTAGAQKVFDSPQTLHTGWNTFEFSTPFAYNGTDNLLLIVRDSTGSYVSGNSWYTHSTPEVRARYLYQDGSVYPLEPASSTSGTTLSVRNNVIFGGNCDSTATCIAPNVYISEVTENSITLNWAPGNYESSWELETSTDNTTWTPQGMVTSAPYTLTNLSPSTLYYIRLRSDCGGGEYSNWAMVSDRTECAPITTVPYMENFDSYSGATTTSVAANNLPYCWSNYNTGTSTSYSGYPIIYASATYAASGVNAMRFYTYTTSGTYADQTAILPPVDVNTLPMNTLQLTFDARQNTTSYPFVLEIGVMTDPTNINTFVVLSTVTCQSTTYANYEIPLSQYTGTGAYIAIRAPQPTSGYNYGYVDNVIIEHIPTCPKPTQVHATNTSTNSIELGWTESGSATSWVIEYGPAGFTIGNGTEVTANTNPFTVTGLTSSTVYDFYVKADCGGGDLSNYTATYSAATECDAIDQLPYTENFDVYGTGETAYPLCWGKINTYSSNRPYVSATHYEGVGSLYFYAGTSGTYNIAVMPAFDATIPVNTLQATFMYRATYASDMLIVGVMSNPTDASTFVPVDTVYPSTGSVSTWVPQEVVFSNYSGTGQYIAFKNAYTSTYCYSYVDNLYIETIPTCPRPASISVSNVSDNSVQLSWVSTGSETAWNVEYKETSASTWTVVPVTTNPYTLSGLTAGTSYDVRVQADCGAGDVSNYRESSFQTAFCSLADQCGYTFILGDGYGDGWNSGYLTVEQNGTVLATVEAVNHGLSSTQTYDTVVLNLCTNLALSLVWHTGSFDDEVSITLLGPDGAQLYSIVDLDNVTNYTLFSFTTNCSGAGPVITDPTVATNDATAIAQTSATLNAAITNPDNVTITAKGFEWKATTGGTYTQVTGTGTGNNFSYNLTGLTPNTSYTFKAFITYNGTTTYGSEKTFTTLNQDVEPCDVPTGVTTSGVTHESITVSWNAASGVNSWNIQYRPVGGTLSSATSNTNSYTITGLQPETTYEIQVQANCGDGNLSEWSSTTSATTTVGIDSWLDNSVSLYPNPAKEYVDIRVDGDLNVTMMEVYDVYGKLINTVNVIDNPTRINVSTLADGMYFVRVTTEKGAVTKTFVKK